jgi:aminocarboxymuconate-semialdehyde decarboxylase
MKIDIHSHIEVPEATDLLPVKTDDMPSLLTGESAAHQKAHHLAIRDQIRNPERKLADMRKMGVDLSVISITPSEFYYHLEGDLALKVARTQNEGISAFVRRFPDKFVGVAAVPLQNPAAAAAELERAVVELKLKGVEVGSNIQGRYLGDPSFLPFFEKARALDVPIFIHPHAVAGADRLQDYYLTNLIGNPLDTTVTAAHLIFAGVFDRFPGLKIVLSHAGGYLPYIIGRFEHGWEVRPECRKSIRRSPVEYLKEFYFDTITHGRDALRYLISTVGADRVVLGTDHPYDMADMDPVRSLNAVPGLTAGEKEKIAGGNALSLLKMG